MSFFDVIVIGSGPAGCSAALTCHHAGLNVLVVTLEPDQLHATPSTPVPLESIHPGVSSLLAKIEASEAAHAATAALYSGIYTGSSYTPLGEDSSGIWQGMHIDREIFDHQLLQSIRNAGVEVRYNEKVVSCLQENDKVIGIRTGSMEYYANYVIDASGKNGLMGKKLNFKQQFFSPPLFCWTGVSEYTGASLYDQQAAHFISGTDGWSWLAPQPPNFCSWTRLSIKGKKSVSPPDELKKGKVIGEIHFANMRWRLFRPVCSEGILLCGDAAGVLDPAAGQGILNALWSGIFAANAAVKCLQEPDYAAFHLANYDTWFVQQFEAKVDQLKAYYKENGITVFNK